MKNIFCNYYIKIHIFASHVCTGGLRVCAGNNWWLATKKPPLTAINGILLSWRACHFKELVEHEVSQYPVFKIHNKHSLIYQNLQIPSCHNSVKLEWVFRPTSKVNFCCKNACIACNHWSFISLFYAIMKLYI